MSRIILYDYYRSSAAYRLRIALNLKQVAYEQRPVNLVEGEQQSAEYKKLNPQGLVPMLEIDGHRITQTMAIIGYLDQKFPNQPLVPAAAEIRAHVIALCLVIVADIHPLQNLRVGKYLADVLGVGDDQRLRWNAHWITEGLPALEALAKPQAGAFLFGDGPTAADICLVPQMYNARRYKVPLDDYPTLLRAEENANKLEAFAAAHPDRQPVPGQ
jgi:maleylacetoacetate isomerase